MQKDSHPNCARRNPRAGFLILGHMKKRNPLTPLSFEEAVAQVEAFERRPEIKALLGNIRDIRRARAKMKARGLKLPEELRREQAARRKAKRKVK